MVERLSTVLTKWSTKWVPDAWIIAVLLTFIAFILALIFTTATPFEIIIDWGQQFWALNSFSMQMALIILTGYILASAPPVHRLLDRLARIPKNPFQTVALMAFVSMASAWINWGFSVVGSAVFARYLARHQKGVDYRLLVAAGYLGMGTFWHSGLSASAPLLVATPKHFMEAQIGIIPVTQTIFHPFNLIICLIILVFFTVFTPMLHPKKKENIVEIDPSVIQEMENAAAIVVKDKSKMTPSEKIENNSIINIIVGVAGIGWIIWYLATKGFNINLDIVNFLFLMVGILLHGTPKSLLKAAEEGAGSVWGVLLQFPFYAGIMGIIQGSGLSDVISNWFLSFSTSQTYPVIVYWYSGILNYFVPSGGSKWAVEAPYIIQAGQALGVPNNLTVLAYAWGDMATDIIQPFWAIPLLGIAKLGFKDIMGFCLILFICFIIITSVGFLLAPMFF